MPCNPSPPCTCRKTELTRLVITVGVLLEMAFVETTIAAGTTARDEALAAAVPVTEAIMTWTAPQVVVEVVVQVRHHFSECSAECRAIMLHCRAQNTGLGVCRPRQRQRPGRRRRQLEAASRRLYHGVCR